MCLERSPDRRAAPLARGAISDDRVELLHIRQLPGRRTAQGLGVCGVDQPRGIAAVVTGRLALVRELASAVVHPPRRLFSSPRPIG